MSVTPGSMSARSLSSLLNLAEELAGENSVPAGDYRQHTLGGDMLDVRLLAEHQGARIPTPNVT